MPDPQGGERSKNMWPRNVAIHVLTTSPPGLYQFMINIQDSAISRGRTLEHLSSIYIFSVRSRVEFGTNTGDIDQDDQSNLNKHGMFCMPET